MLYDQLRYFESIFDADRIRRRFEATITSKLQISVHANSVFIPLFANQLCNL